MIQIYQDPSMAQAVARRLDPQLARVVVRRAFSDFMWRHLEKHHFHAARLALKSLVNH